MFKMPRVVANQKEKFETDDLMKRHAREGEVCQSVAIRESSSSQQTFFIEME